MPGKSSKTIIVGVRISNDDYDAIQNMLKGRARRGLIYMTLSDYLRGIIHQTITSKPKRRMSKVVAKLEIGGEQSITAENPLKQVARIKEHISNPQVSMALPQRAQFSPAIIRYTFRRDKGKCVYCGRLAQQVDHVISGRFGGLNIRSNAVCACRHCNNYKAQHPDDINLLSRAIYWLLEKGEDIHWMDNLSMRTRIMQPAHLDYGIRQDYRMTSSMTA